MLEIRVEATEAKRRLAKFAAAMSPETRAQNNRQAGVQMHADVIRTFVAQGATQGRMAWLPLKAGGRWKGKGTGRRFQTVYQLLSDTGALRASYVPLADQDQAGVGAASMKGHADLAPIHQFGNPAKNLPPRPMLPTGEHAMDVVTRIYGMSIEKAVKP